MVTTQSEPVRSGERSISRDERSSDPVEEDVDNDLHGGDRPRAAFRQVPTRPCLDTAVTDGPPWCQDLTVAQTGSS